MARYQESHKRQWLVTLSSGRGGVPTIIEEDYNGQNLMEIGVSPQRNEWSSASANLQR